MFPEKIQKIVESKQNIIMLTAYDYQMASLLCEAGVDIILVGDSLGNVFQGNTTTRAVSLEDMIYHTKAVARGAGDTLVVSDLSYNSYSTPEEALVSSRKLLDAGADAVKLEGNPDKVVSYLTSRDIPVMGHSGLLPQSAETFKVRGRDTNEADYIIQESKALEEAGVFSIVLECVTLGVAEEITKELSIPTIGIGAGNICRGQVLVINDLLGMSGKKAPKFVKAYANLHNTIVKAVQTFIRDVKEGEYPGEEHTYH